MKGMLQKLTHLFTAISFLFRVPSHSNFSPDSLASYRLAALRTVSKGVYGSLAFVAVIFVSVIAMAAALRAPVPSSAYATVLYGVLVMLFWFATEVLYFTFMCDAQTIRVRRARLPM